MYLINLSFSFCCRRHRLRETREVVHSRFINRMIHRELTLINCPYFTDPKNGKRAHTPREFPAKTVLPLQFYSGFELCMTANSWIYRPRWVMLYVGFFCFVLLEQRVELISFSKNCHCGFN